MSSPHPGLPPNPIARHTARLSPLPLVLWSTEYTRGHTPTHDNPPTQNNAPKHSCQCHQCPKNNMYLSCFQPFIEQPLYSLYLLFAVYTRPVATPHACQTSSAQSQNKPPHLHHANPTLPHLPRHS